MTTFVTGKIIRLQAKLNTADTSLTADIDVGITAGRIYFKNDLAEEWIDFTGVAASGSNFTYSGLTRGLSQTADPATAGTGLTWLAGNSGAVVMMHDQAFNRQKPNTVTFATTAARDTALGADGVATSAFVSVYVTATGLFYNYNLSSNQWEAIDTGTATPNATKLVSGKVELATDAEITAGTDIGGTGASVVITPSQQKKSISLKAIYPFINETDHFVISSIGDDRKITKAEVRNEMAATELLKGTAEFATDAEITTGTSTDKIVTPDQLPKISILQTTRTYNTASGTVNIAHGLSRTPKYVEIIGYASPGADSFKVISHGYSDGSVNKCSFISAVDGGSAVEYLSGNDASNCIHYGSGNATASALQTATITLNSTNVSIIRTYNGDSGSTSTMSLTIIAHA